jgi:hypothetical protein
MNPALTLLMLPLSCPLIRTILYCLLTSHQPVLFEVFLMVNTKKGREYYKQKGANPIHTLDGIITPPRLDFIFSIGSFYNRVIE